MKYCIPCLCFFPYLLILSNFLLAESAKKDFWKVIRVKDADSIKLVTDYPDASGILFENYETGIYGGTGNSFNWNLMNNIKDLDIKIILSGGINISSSHI